MQALKKSWYRAIVFTLSLFTYQAGAGGSNGGGGYSVKCRDGNFYAMDFVATQKKVSQIDPEIDKAKTGAEILGLIEKHLEEIAPELAVSLKDFMLVNEKESDTGTSRLWTDGIHPLEKLTDAQRTRDLTACLGANTDADVFQAVIRNQFEGGIVYNRDPNQLRNLEATGPKQVSFTYLHEWLRDYTENSNIIMAVNYFFHSADFFKMNSEQFETVMRRHGLEKLPGFADRIASKVPALSAIKVTWDGIMYHHVNGTIGLSVYICSKPIEIRDKVGTDFDDEVPDVSACRQVKHVEAQKMPDLRWYQHTIFTSAQMFKMQPFTLFVQGAEINSIGENVAQENADGGPYLSVMLEIDTAPDDYMRAVKNYDLGSASHLKDLRGESCGLMGGSCTKGVNIEVAKRIPVGDHSSARGYFTDLNFELVDLVAR